MPIVLQGARRRDGTEVDYDIVVNCKNRVVSDGVEKYEFRFVYKVFLYCVGDDETDVNVKEVKELWIQPEVKNKSNPNKI